MNKKSYTEYNGWRFPISFGIFPDFSLLTKYLKNNILINTIFFPNFHLLKNTYKISNELWYLNFGIFATISLSDKTLTNNKTYKKDVQ